MAKKQEIPFEQSIEILYRLPVRSLLRFRCLSKRYCSLIDSPEFAKDQHLTSLKNNTNTTLHILHWNSGDYITCFDYDSLETPRLGFIKNPLSCFEIILEENNQVKQNPHKHDPNKDFIGREGFCNGLICLWNFNGQGNLSILNPATRKHCMLPHLGPEIQGELYHLTLVQGFGYDASNDDYRVLRINQYTDDSAQHWRNEVMVCSLKKNAWKKVEVGFPYSLNCNHNESPFVCGNLIVQVAPMTALVPCSQMLMVSGSMLVGFDISAENFNEVPLPDSLIEIPNTIHLYLARLGGCLCVIPFHRNGDHSDIWVMKEYGKKESWKKLFSFLPGTLRHYFAPIPVAYSRMGDKVLLELIKGDRKKKALFWYDLKENKLSIVKELKGKLPLMFLSDVMTDNIISPDVLKGIDEEKVKDKKSKIENDKKKNQEERDDFLSKEFKLDL